MRNRIGLCLVALTLSLPSFAQTAPLGQFAKIPLLDLGRNEAVVGLAPLNSQLALITTQYWYTSPLAPATGSLTPAYTFQGYGMVLTPQTQVTGNPTNSSEMWITGGGTRAARNSLYKLNVTPPVTATPIVFAFPDLPQSLASDGTYAYVVVNGDVLKVDASSTSTTSGSVSLDMNTTTALAVALGPDGKLYVLDSRYHGEILVVDPTTFNVTSSFNLAHAGSGPIAISSIGQLFVLATDLNGTMLIDSYETTTGALIGTTSGDTTFSADVNINPFGHPAMLATNGYLYLVTGTGQWVWEFSTGPRTPAALNCHGATISSLTKQYGGTAAAATALGYPSVSALQTAVRVQCGI